VSQANAIALDSVNVYFTTVSNNVMAVPHSGGTVFTIATAPTTPQGVACDGTSVYWTYGSLGATPGAVMAVSLADGGSPFTIATDPDSPAGVAVFSVAGVPASVYWADDSAVGTVRSAPIEGIPDAGQGNVLGVGAYPLGITADPLGVYWTNSNEFTGGSVAMFSGGTAVTLAPGSGPYGIATDSANVYWTNFTGGTVMAFSRSFSTTMTLASEEDGPRGVAADGTSVYWVDEGGNIMKVSLDGGTPTTLENVTTQVYGVAVDATSVYWTSGFGVQKLTPK
jgi:sugar lactone lactonase YvrE